MPSPYLDDLLSNLTAAEKKSINHHISSISQSEDLLLRQQVEIVARLDGDNKPVLSRNRMHKSRVLNQIIDILISDYHIHKKENFVSQDQAILRLKKRMLFARMISKSLTQQRFIPFKTILTSIITEAEKNEVYEVLAEALSLKKYTFALKTSLKEFEKINKQIRHASLCQEKIYYAADCYFKIIINSNHLKVKSDKELLLLIARTIRQLKIDYSKYRSQQINYYLHYILMFYYEKQKRYLLSAKYAKKLLEIVKSSPIIHREDRLGFALISLSQYKTFTENYSEAAKYAQEAQKHYLEGSNNYIVSKEQEFHIYFYHKKYDKASDCMKKLLERNILDSGQFVKATYVYFNSALEFAQKQYKQSYKLLNKSLEIEKDKSRWNISLRIMNIMLCIELHKIDEASRLLESLRKYVQRHEKSTEIKERDLLIVRTLREMEKDGFNYSKKNKVINKNIKELSQKGKLTSWEHYSPELIPFHEWLAEK